MSPQHTTHWTALLNPNHREKAWKFFYENYRGAVTALFRHKGISTSDLEDLVHEFFVMALERKLLEKADPERGRFRSYLRLSAERFLVSEFRKSNRLKRRIDGVRELEQVYAHSLQRKQGRPTPEEAFDRAWARALLERSRLQTARDLTKKGKERYFQAFMLRQTGARWSDVALRFESTVAAVRSWVGHVEKTHRRFLRNEIAGTVSGAANVNRELDELSPFLTNLAPEG